MSTSAAERGLGPEAYTPEQQVLIRNLLTSSCIQFGQFRLTSGRESPYIFYIPQDENHGLFLMLSKESAKLASIAHPDLLSPVPTASTYIGGLVAERLSVPPISVRIKEKYEEGRFLIDGFRQEFVGRKAVIFDDAATTGGSIIRDAEGLRSVGIEVDVAVVVIDRQEGAREALDKEGIRLLAVFGAREMFDYARNARTAMGQKVISEGNYQRAIAYLNQYKPPSQ